MEYTQGGHDTACTTRKATQEGSTAYPPPSGDASECAQIGYLVESPQEHDRRGWGGSGSSVAVSADAAAPITTARLKDYVIYVRDNDANCSRLLAMICPFAERCWIQYIEAIPPERREEWMNYPPVVVSLAEHKAFIGEHAFIEIQRYLDELRPTQRFRFTSATRHTLTSVEDAFTEDAGPGPSETICGRMYERVDPRAAGLGARILADGEKVNSAHMAEYVRIRNATAPFRDLIMTVPDLVKANESAPQPSRGHRGEHIREFVPPWPPAPPPSLAAEQPQRNYGSVPAPAQAYQTAPSSVCNLPTEPLPRPQLPAQGFAYSSRVLHGSSQPLAPQPMQPQQPCASVRYTVSPPSYTSTTMPTQP